MATFAAFANIAEVVDLTNIGTLFAFVLVSAGVIVLRRMEPDRVRPFRAPLGADHADHLDRDLPLPDAAAARGSPGSGSGSGSLLGLVIYFLYGVRNSRLARRAKAQGRLAA